MMSVGAPKIIVTEPSPMPPSKEGRVPREDKVLEEEAASAGATQSSVSIPATTQVASSGGFKPSDEDCHDCKGETSTPEREGTPESEPAEDIPTYTPTDWCLLHYCRIWTQDWRLKCLVLFEALLLPAFASAAYMGAANINKCKLNVSIPILLFMVGVIGFATIAGTLVQTVRKLYRIPPQSTLTEWIPAGAIMAIMLLITDFMITVLSNPSDEPNNDKYCDATLYTYTTYFNYIGIALILMVLVFLGLKNLAKSIHTAWTTRGNGNEQ